MTRNLKDRTQPLVAMVFVEMFSNRPYGEYFIQRISLTMLIGVNDSCDSLGKQSKSTKKSIETHDLLVDFLKSSWRYNLFVKAVRDSRDHPYPSIDTHLNTSQT